MSFERCGLPVREELHGSGGVLNVKCQNVTLHGSLCPA